MLTPQEIAARGQTLKTAMQGFNKQDVQKLLEEVINDFSVLYKENAMLKSKMKVLVEKVEEYRATEDSMRATLMAAQRTAETIVTEAQQRRDQLMAQAEAEARNKIGMLRGEAEGLEERIRRGKESLQGFSAAIRAVCDREMQFLNQLPQIMATPSPAQTQTAATAQEIQKNLMATLRDTMPPPPPVAAPTAPPPVAPPMAAPVAPPPMAAPVAPPPMAAPAAPPPVAAPAAPPPMAAPAAPPPMAAPTPPPLAAPEDLPPDLRATEFPAFGQATAAPPPSAPAMPEQSAPPSLLAAPEDLPADLRATEFPSFGQVAPPPPAMPTMPAASAPPPLARPIDLPPDLRATEFPGLTGESDIPEEPPVSPLAHTSAFPPLQPPPGAASADKQETTAFPPLQVEPPPMRINGNKGAEKKDDQKPEFFSNLPGTQDLNLADLKFGRNYGRLD